MEKGIISAAQPEAVEAGAEILKSGGNAVDATICAALVQTVVDPLMCGIAGFGSMHLFLPELNEHKLIDFYGKAPLNVKEDMWEELIEKETEDGFGFILKGRVNEMGYQSITTPMTLKALSYVSEKFGTIEISELLNPAISYAENGFLVRPHVSFYLNNEKNSGRMSQFDKIKNFKSAKKVFFKNDNELFQAGDILKNQDMAKTYKEISKKGVNDFYEGNLAKKMISDIKYNDGLLSMLDLKDVKPKESIPLKSSYKDYEITTNSPPGGGIMLLEMLNIIENFNIEKLEHNSAEYIVLLSEVMKIATVDKDKYIGDPKFVDVPISLLISKDYALKKSEFIKAGNRTKVSRFNKRIDETKDTTHVTTVDSLGNCVSLTHSLGNPSCVITEGLGFMYNGCMGVFDPRPGNADSIAPGKSRFSAMCPTIVFRKGEPFFIVGAPGGTFITMGVLQSILNVIHFGMNAQEAVSAPRFCATSNTIDLSNRILRSTEAELIKG